MQDIDISSHPSVELSVLMCVYNGDVFLVQAIESILAQTFTEFEFIIVDDASTDKTPQILAEYAQKDSRIKILKNSENLGLTKSLNIGLHAAQGKYIARMDADDIALPDRFMTQYWFMEEHPSLAAIGSFVQVIDKKGQVLGEKKLAVSYEDIKSKMLFNNQFIHSTLFFRADRLKESGGYDESFRKSQDYELMFRLSSKYPVANLTQNLLQFRFHTESISWTNTEQQKNGIRARWNAIRIYQYPFLKGMYHIIIRLFWLAVPKKLKVLYAQKKMQHFIKPI